MFSTPVPFERNSLIPTCDSGSVCGLLFAYVVLKSQDKITPFFFSFHCNVESVFV